MKKLKAFLLTIAIVSGVGMAVASTAKAPCDSQTQYYLSSNGNYYPAGIEGYDYVCEFGHFSTCTYYYIEKWDAYYPCKSGRILWLR